MMADYRLTDTDIVIRTKDFTNVPNIPGNADRQQYDLWLMRGNVPDPYSSGKPKEYEPDA